MLSNRTGNASGRLRRYLPSAERKQEILEAALQEFSAHGYVSTTMERIAARVGLTKGGVYAHYRSKEEIFEDLLTWLLAPPNIDATWSVREGESLPQIVDSYLDHSYGKLNDPAVLATFRLILAESARMPDLLQQWAARMLEPLWARDQALVDACVNNGKMRRSVLTDNFILAGSPAIFGAILQILFAERSPISMAKTRATHRKLLLEILQP